MQKKSVHWLYPWIVWLLGTLFYAYEFFQRASPNVMADSLMHDFHLQTVGYGTLASMYQWAYVIMQIPAGLLVDRYGPRRLLTMAILLVSVGALVFSLTHIASIAFIARAFVGAGSAFAFVCSLKLIAEWFPPRRFAMVAGFTQFLGYCGASLGGAPLRFAVDHLSWRNALLDTAFFGVLLAVSVWLVVRDSPTPYQKKPHKKRHNMLRGLGEVLAKRQMWLNGLYASCMMGPTAVFINAWGSNYLHYVDGFTPETAAIAVSLISIGVAIGSPCFGWFSDYIGRRRLPLVFAAMGALLVTTSLLYWPQIPHSVAYIFCILFGFFQSAHVLNFTLAHEINRPAINGAAIGVLNMLTVAGGAVFQPLVGWFLSVSEQAQHHYSVASYHWSLLLLPIVQTMAFITALLFIKETYGKPKQAHPSVHLREKIAGLG